MVAILQKLRPARKQMQCASAIVFHDWLLEIIFPDQSVDDQAGYS